MIFAACARCQIFRINCICAPCHTACAIYARWLIISFRHKGLEAFYRSGSTRGQACEEALPDSTTLRRFVGIDLGRERVPDATTLLKLRRLLEDRKLSAALSAKAGEVLQGRSMKAGTLTIVDAATISAPSSTKSEDKARGPEMRQTHRGKVRDRGLAKNATRAFAVLGRVHICLARRRLGEMSAPAGRRSAAAAVQSGALRPGFLSNGLAHATQRENEGGWQKCAGLFGVALKKLLAPVRAGHLHVAAPGNAGIQHQQHQQHQEPGCQRSADQQLLVIHRVRGVAKRMRHLIVFGRVISFPHTKLASNPFIALRFRD